MTPQPLRIRILAALELAPMTVRDLSRCLCASRHSVDKKLSEFGRLGVVVSRPIGRRRNGRPAHVYGLRA